MPDPEPSSIQEARDRHAREIIEATMQNEPLQEQIRASHAAVERGDTGTPWEDVEAKARARHAGQTV